ncbi:hypothetical protein [Streptomyces sp. MK37H]|uniref:hypothetical protein n=1 Tax=Streptomyces sp. MK37H TaxID=2699117 RepID=UPI001B37CAE4|nr:hypothetical protein [Streptomyces sp. MK37H]MBP8538582.1 hypothetical protein [Streptomyces sp. MK37H]
MTTQPEPVSPAPLPPSLITYLAQRDAQHADAVRAVLASLTDRERALIRDAAVMGYVRGTMHPQGERCPKDSAIVAEVIDACRAFPDLYPAVDSVVQQGTGRAVALDGTARRSLTPEEYSAAWHAVEAAVGAPGADPATVLLAVLNALGIQPPAA